jgi:hypothetical protein
MDLVSGANFNFYSGGSKTIFISNAGIFPATAGTGLIGYSGGPFASINANAFFIYDDSSDEIASFTEVSSGLKIMTSFATGPLSIITADNPTGNTGTLTIESGAATSGNAGNVVIVPGASSGGANGSVLIQDSAATTAILIQNNTEPTASNRALVWNDGTTVVMEWGGQSGDPQGLATFGIWIATPAGESAPIAIETGAGTVDSSGTLCLATGPVSGSAFTPSGSMFLTTGNSSLDGVGTGSISLTPGSVTTGTMGNVQLNAAAVIGAPSTTPTHNLNTSTGTNSIGALTLTNAPTGISGNPTGYVTITINGTLAYLPYWT